MRKKKITVNIDTTYKYVQLWNGIFDLTNKELTILAAFIIFLCKASSLAYFLIRLLLSAILL